MKVSGLIHELTRIQRLHGDLDVHLDAPGFLASGATMTTDDENNKIVIIASEMPGFDPNELLTSI